MNTKKYLLIFSTIFSLLLIGPVYAQSSQVIVLTSDKTEGTAPLAVNFQADLRNFTKCGNTYIWDFGTGPGLALADSCADSTVLASRIITSSHTYDSPGTYNVNFKVNGVVSNSVVITVRSNVLQPLSPLVPTTFYPYRFYRDLTLGSFGEDVMALQRFLNKEGIFVAVVGFGSSGNETKYFGRFTQMALSKWQAAHNISPTFGYFGIRTRTAINTRMGY